MEQKYGVWAVRSANSICGAAESRLMENGVPIVFDSKDKASNYADKLNTNIPTPNIHYYVKEMEQEEAESYIVAAEEHLKL